MGVRGSREEAGRTCFRGATMTNDSFEMRADFADMPILHRCANDLDVSVAHACGLLVCFWGKVSLYKPDGVLANISDTRIEAWATWDGERGRFAQWIRAHHSGHNGFRWDGGSRVVPPENERLTRGRV